MMHMESFDAHLLFRAAKIYAGVGGRHFLH